jgi:sulfide:quinone oxidoreductase
MEARADTGTGPARVVIAGGGIAGLEALLALRDLAGELADVVVVAPEPDFVYRPLLVEEPFSHQPAERRDLAAAVEEIGGTLVRGAVTGFAPAEQVVALADGERVSYDRAVVCVGARATHPFRSARTFAHAGETLELAELLGGEPGASIAFVVPPAATWALPIYELALMTQRQAAQQRAPVDIRIVTPESAPLIAFGTRGSEEVARMLEARGIAITAAKRAHEVDGQIILTPGDEVLEADHVVTLPVLEGPGLTGLPADEQGFLPIDQHARVRGVEGIYAAGDGTNFPIKQGGLGTQQADAAAEHIAAELGAVNDPQPFHPVLRGMLITGDETLSMQHSLTGGEGEGEVSSDYLWWPPQKVGGRYLAPWLAGVQSHADLTPPARGIEIEVSLPHEWHEQPMAIDPLEPPEVN